MIVSQEVVDSISEWYQTMISNRVQQLKSLIPSMTQLSEEWNEDNRLKSHDFNLFIFFKPNETTHSRILAFFLNPLESHGQGNLFLEQFLRRLRIASPEKGPWIVTAEKGRIDVLVKRMHPHSVVIIENKSNGAEDQDNQLYRYWYQEIYQKQIERNASKKQIQSPDKRYYKMLYLAPSIEKTPADFSLCRPSNWDDDRKLPERVPIAPEHYLFRSFVVDWLNDCLVLLPDFNHRMKEFTKQYIEAWQ